MFRSVCIQQFTTLYTYDTLTSTLSFLWNFRIGDSHAAKCRHLGNVCRHLTTICGHLMKVPGNRREGSVDLKCCDAGCDFLANTITNHQDSTSLWLWLVVGIVDLCDYDWRYGGSTDMVRTIRSSLYGNSQESATDFLGTCWISASYLLCVQYVAHNNIKIMEIAKVQELKIVKRSHTDIMWHRLSAKM